MSSTTRRAAAGKTPQTARWGESTTPSEPEHPFRGLKEGWVKVPRGPRRPAAQVESVLVIELDPQRTAWVLAEAERTGVAAQPQRVVESLIDAARGG